MAALSYPDGTPALQITHVSPAPRVETWEHGVIWRGLDEVVIDLGEAHWYGQGSLIHQLYPLERIAQYQHHFLTSDNGVTGLLGLLEPLWITSTGVGIWVQDDSFSTGFNAPLTGQPPAHSFQTPAPHHERPLDASTIETDGRLTIRGSGLSIYFFLKQNARDVVEAFWTQINPPPAPPDDVITKPLWTTWAHFKTDIDQPRITQFAHDIIDHGFECAILGIDDRWQERMGDSHFHPERFPDPGSMLHTMETLGFRTTVWTAPFIEESSEHFKTGVEQDYVYKNGQGEPYMARWWGGIAALVCTARDEALDWYFGNFRRDLHDRFHMHGIKVDGGEGMFYAQPGMVIPDNKQMNLVSQGYVRAAARNFPWSDTRAAWRTQGEAMLFRQWDKSSAWGFDNGLASCITQAITLNLIGYPHSFPDMIGGNKYADQVVTSELLIRWAQAVAPMPMIQFSIPPWLYGEECNRLCAAAAQLHAAFAPRNIALYKEGGPLVRPLWWIDPTDPTAQVIGDQYLIGNDVLVAPVIIEGARSRDIYLPVGTWRSYWTHEEIHEGNTWLRDYPAPLDVLPLFERISR